MPSSNHRLPASADVAAATSMPLLLALVALACAPHREPGEAPAPAWAEVTAVREEGQRRAVGKHDFAGHLELPDGEAGEHLDFHTAAVLTREALYVRGEPHLRLTDGWLPADSEIVDDRVVGLLRALEAEFAGDGWSRRRVALFADRRVRFSTFWPIYRSIERALQVMAVKLVVHRADDPPNTSSVGLSLSDSHDWDGSMRLSGSGAAAPDDPLSAVQLAVAIGPAQLEVGRIAPDGRVHLLEVIPNQDGLAPLGRLAERLYNGRDPDAYGEVGALIYAHDDATIERLVGVATHLMGPQCGPAEHAAEASPRCWFKVRVEGRRAGLDGLKLDRW
ncbi:MAG: hypothetical protein JNL82_15110 [Myxococcales bacterium]|nr:hypothetical protein [Myxococcales bacterium]